MSADVDVASEILRYLEDEEQSLRTALQAMTEVRAALMNANHDGLHQLLDRHNETAELIVRQKRRRERFRADAANQLGIDGENVSLSRLIDQVPEQHRDALQSRRRAVQAQAMQLEQAFRDNTALVVSGLSFLQRFVSDLVGAPGSGRYGADGEHYHAMSDAFLDVRG